MIHLLASVSGRLGSSGFDSEVVPVVAIVFTFVWLIVKTLVSPFVAAKANKNAVAKAGGNATPSGDEALLIRQMQQTLTKMEERVEALETILLEQSRSQKL